jgi:hypothetical protein
MTKLASHQCLERATTLLRVRQFVFLGGAFSFLSFSFYLFSFSFFSFVDVN